MADSRCHACGALLFSGAAFCAQCHAAVPSADEVSSFLTEVDAAGGRWRRQPIGSRGWEPDAVHTAPPPAWERSRWRGNALHFGPAGRVATTALCFLASVLVILSPSPASAAIIVPALLWVVYAVWKPARVRPRPGSDATKPRI